MLWAFVIPTISFCFRRTHEKAATRNLHYFQQDAIDIFGEALGLTLRPV